MTTRPELHIAVAKTKNKASDYNDNFDMTLDYIDNTASDLQSAITSVSDSLSSFVAKTNVANKGSATVPVYFNSSGVAQECTGIDTSLLTGSGINYVKTTYASGNSGYVIYSNGYCEQWGKISLASSVTVNLTKTYSSTNFNIMLTPEWSTYTYLTVKNSGKTSSSFVILGGGNTHYAYWRTCGYLANGQY